METKKKPEFKEGIIYLIAQGKTKKVVTKGSFERMKLTGEWKILKEFEK